MTRFTDNCNRANGAIGANYARASGVAGNIVVDTNQLLCSGAADTMFRVTSVSFGNDQEMEVEIVSGLGSGTDYAEVGARVTGTDGTLNGYTFYSDGASGASHTEIGQYVNNVISVLKTIATTFTAGDKLKGRVTGSNPVVLTIYKNGVLVDTYNDVAAGRIQSGGTIAIGTYSDGGLRLDNIDGGDVAGGSTPTITDVDDESFRVGEVGVTITGTNFGTSQATGFVKICPTDDINDANGVTQTVTAWTSGTAIVFNVVAASTLPRNTNAYLFVKNDAGASNAAGYVVQITPNPGVLAFALLN